MLTKFVEPKEIEIKKRHIISSPAGVASPEEKPGRSIFQALVKICPALTVMAVLWLSGFNTSFLFAQGVRLDYSSYLSDDAWNPSIAIDTAGCIYITGDTLGEDFPLLNAYQSSWAGDASEEGGDGFVSKFTSDGSALLYSTYLGGDRWDRPKEIVVDTMGSVYMSGLTKSSNFPIKNAYQSTQGSSYDAFITKFTTDYFR